MGGLERDFGSMVEVERFVYGLGKTEKGRNMTSGSPVFDLSIHGHVFVIYCEERPSLGRATRGGRLSFVIPISVGDTSLIAHEGRPFFPHSTSLVLATICSLGNCSGLLASVFALFQSIPHGGQREPSKTDQFKSLCWFSPSVASTALRVESSFP